MRQTPYIAVHPGKRSHPLAENVKAIHLINVQSVGDTLTESENE